MEIFENNMSHCYSDEDMMMPYPPMNGMPCPYPMPGPGHMPYPPMNGMPCPHPMPEPMPMPYPPMNGMPCPHPMPEPMPMPYPPMNGMPCPHPMPEPMPMPMPEPIPSPYPPMNGMPGPMPMPPMPIEECDEEMLNHMEQMYCMHMYMAAMNKTEAYKHKMMHCYCKHHMDDH